MMNKYFNLDEDIIYLNHAAVSPWPTPTANAVRQFADENATLGSQNYLAWMDVERTLRTKLSTLINAASADEIALLKSTSEGLSFIAYGLTWKSGDNIVIPAEEFPSNKIVWQSLENKGIETRLVPISGSSNPEALLIEAMDSNTRLLSCSSVQYATGLRLDLEKLGAACKDGDNKVLFCIDAIQSIGAVDFDAQKYRADFVVADGHKWMMGPEGLALFYCRKELIRQLKLHEFGWRMLENPGDFSQKNFVLSSSASRFECGSPNMIAIHALNASLDVVFEVGTQEVERMVLQNTEYLINKLQQISNCEVLTPTESCRHAGIVTFVIKSIDSDKLYNHLMKLGVMCASRGAGVRFSPHFYIGHSQLDQAIKLVAEYNEKH